MRSIDLDGLREALKLADLLGRMLHDVLAQRPAIKGNPEWGALVERAQDALVELQREMETAEMGWMKRQGVL